MEKQTRTYVLDSIKRSFRLPEDLGGKITSTAFRDANRLGLSTEDIIAVIQALTRKVKVLTTWQVITPCYFLVAARPI